MFLFYGDFIWVRWECRRYNGLLYTFFAIVREHGILSGYLFLSRRICLNATNNTQGMKKVQKSSVEG